MAVVTALVHRDLRFTDKHGAERLYPMPTRQVISPRIMANPYLAGALASGWVTDVQEVAEAVPDLNSGA
jgi:hypothetical protein